MMNLDSGRFKVKRPQQAQEVVDPRTIGKLAERLFRKNLAAQYVANDHGFLVTEDKLVQECVRDLRKQLQGAVVVHLAIASIHLMVMEAAADEAQYMESSLEDVEEHVLQGALEGVEKDSLDLLATLALPE